MGNIVLTSHELGIDLGGLEGVQQQTDLDGYAGYADPDGHAAMVMAELQGDAHESVLQRLEADLDQWHETLVFLQKQIQARFTETNAQMEEARAVGLQKGKRGRVQFFKGIIYLTPFQ